ncbi:MAG: family 16 glycosylhydrolase [Clostridia bacterium]|nr:family 16 glycosylhydrolase [Clostridia bacterium]
MKKIKKPLIAVLSTTVAAASLFALAACNPQLTDEPLNATKIADYTKTAEDRAETFASGSKGYSWENGGAFNVWWKPQNVSYEGGKMSLSISEMTQKEQAWDEEKGENVDCIAEYYGAEERSEHYYGYGDFQVRMKPAKIVGTASTFFTCTGPYDKWYNEDGTEVIKTNKHDEIDIEFLGKDTTKVQFNYFADGKGGHEYMYDLGFDASVEFHDYGYRWTEKYITWFVDSTPVYRVDRKGSEAWPEAPGRIIMNYWCGTEEASSWMGEFKDDYSGKAEYEYVATSATQCPDPNTAHIKDEPVIPPDTSEVPTEGWTDISTDGFDGWSMYTVDKTNGLKISHDTKKGSWDCCGMPLADCYDWVKFTVKNEEATAATVRISIKDTALPDTAAAAIAGVVAESGATYDKGAGVVIINLEANEELDVALKMKAEYANQMTLFLNSTDNATATTGSITITELKGIVNEDIAKPEPPKPNEDGTVAINYSGFGGWDMYDVDNTDGINISHKTDKIGTYQCCGMDLSSDYGVVKFTVKNNSSDYGAVIKIDIKKKGEAEGDNGTGGVETAIATKGGAEDCYAYHNDYDDSVVIVIAAGAELEIEVTIKDEVVVNQLVVFFNSTGDATATEGDVTISDLRGAAKTADDTETAD